ncbi:response regulator transcription factor [Aquipuribacter nitratireducens]|uniref:Response regulator transcription factor n=1 Tax=Aquipuribacter nitratireducens TaxID=650104 RepID=A0ABW0GQK6_9MICO
MTLLVVEDEPGITAFVRQGLEAAGYPVATAADGWEGLDLARREDVRLVILDLGLPGLSGEQVLARIRQLRPALPVIVLTAKDTVEDRVAGLEAGADDYVVKPFSFSELLARVRARLRQPEQATSTTLVTGDLELDVLTRRARVAGSDVTLSSREFVLLEVLIRHAGQVLSRPQLLDRVWGYDFDGASNVVEVYVGHLRRKLGPERIETVRGAGYRLVAG